MASLDVKEELHSYLRGARETLVWKLDGLSEYDIRRPLTPTGTNLLGLVKHSTATHDGYFGELFGRARGKTLPEWAKEFDCTSWAQFFLKFILGNPAVMCVIPATGDPKHLLDNVAAGTGRLPDDAMREKMAAYFEGL